MSVLDNFEYRTIDARVAPNQTVKIIAHCYGDLGTFRIDTWLRQQGNYEGLLSGKELWGVLILSNGAMFFGCPVFKSLDNAAGFIFGINMLTNSWARCDLQEFHHIKLAVRVSMDQFDGVLLAGFLASIVGEDWRKHTEKAGARMDLNGYRPDS